MPPRTLTRNVVVSSGFSVMVLVYFFHGFCRVGGRMADQLKIDGEGMVLQDNFGNGKVLDVLNCYLCSHSPKFSAIGHKYRNLTLSKEK